MKKQAKSKVPVVASPVDQDIVGLITTLVGKLVSLETKIDTLLSRTPARSPEPPRQHPMPAPSAEQRRDTRTMYRVICEDCRKECEVPFRPIADRPVYCKECFTKRKNSGTFKPRPTAGPTEGPVAAARPAEKQAPEHAKPARKKKPAAKKKKKT